MSTGERPPGEVFCMTCGPDAVLERDPDAPVHQRFAAWLREHIDPTWDTSTLTPDETAERVAAWIRPQLP